jgi:hypothetical protein
MAEFPTTYPDARSPRSAGMATAALALGIISIPATCVCVGPALGIVAIVLGAVAASRAKRQPHFYTGGGRAVGGIVTGSISLVLLLAVGLFGAVLGKSLWKSGFIQAAVDMSQLEASLKAYEQVHHDYPPDLTTLAAEGFVKPSPPRTAAAPGDPFPGFKYVRDVHPSDPPHWILAYQPTSLGPIKLVAVIYADGHGDYAEAGEFAKTEAAFQKEYEAARGAPPEIVPTEGKP